MKNKLLPFAVMTSLMFAVPAVSAEENCDKSCQESIDFTKLIDAKEKEVLTLQKDIEIERIKKELSTLKEGATESSGIDDEFKEMILSKLEMLEVDVDRKIQEMDVAEETKVVETLQVIQDTTGIDNIFVTGTSSVGSKWKARVYYNNSIEGLFVGEDVYPGAIIKSIDRRGMVVVSDGKEYVKRITSTEIAHARAFNNIQEENEIKKINRQSVSQPDDADRFAPPY